jgi:hypothetical protein
VICTLSLACSALFLTRKSSGTGFGAGGPRAPGNWMIAAEPLTLVNLLSDFDVGGGFG